MNYQFIVEHNLHQAESPRLIAVSYFKSQVEKFLTENKV